MTSDLLEILALTKVQNWLEAHLEDDPGKLALSAGKAPFPMAPVLTQLKLLQKSRTKLPSFFRARCLLPPRAYEQASSERAVAMKSYTGQRGLDLTCGLGVDSFFLSKNFGAWTALEADPSLAKVVEYNFQKLGATQVDVRATPAEAFLASYEGPRFDLIYADPDRRDAGGRRLVRLEDCQPDLLALLPLLRRHTHRLLVKLSPLFDLREAERLFPEELSSLGVISVDDECKEVLLDLNFDSPSLSPIREVWLDRQGQRFHFSFPKQYDQAVSPDAQTASHFLLQPDVALYKSQRTVEFFQDYYSELAGGMNHREGFFFTDSLPPSPFPGKIFEVRESLPFKPKALRKRFQKQALNVVRRHFPLTVKEIRRLTSIPEGGSDFLICTQLGGQKVALLCAVV